jgi:hypothetical protein
MSVKAGQAQGVFPAVRVGLRCGDITGAGDGDVQKVFPAVSVGLRCGIPRSASHRSTAGVFPAVKVGLRCSARIHATGPGKGRASPTSSAGSVAARSPPGSPWPSDSRPSPSWCHHHWSRSSRNGQRFQRYSDHCWWFAGNLLATSVAAGSREAVCAGGRDRFRTCGLCRVKRQPPSGCGVEPELIRADASEVPAGRVCFEVSGGT